MDGLDNTPIRDCLACHKPAANKRGLCRACYIAAWRRVKLGDTWEAAVADRRWMLRRRRVRQAIVTGLLLLCLGSVQAAEPDIRKALITYQIAFTADIWSTERGLDRGFTEANPLSEARPSDEALAFKYAAWSVTVWMLAEKVAPKHPKAAKWILLGGALIHSACAVHNERLNRAGE